MLPLSSLLPWPPQTTTSSPTTCAPRVVAIRDTLTTSGFPLLATLAATLTATLPPSSPPAVFLSCSSDSVSTARASLLKHKVDPNLFTIHSLPNEYSAQILESLTPPTPESFLQSIYNLFKTFPPPPLIIISDISALATLFSPSLATSFLQYLLSFRQTTTLLTLVAADSSFQSSHFQAHCSKLLNVAGISTGTVDCKWIGVGGTVGLTEDQHGAAFDDAADALHSNGPLHGMRGDYSPMSLLGTPGSLVVRSADVVFDVTELPSGFAKDAHGGIKVWCNAGGKGYGEEEGPGEAWRGNFCVGEEGGVKGVRLTK